MAQTAVGMVMLVVGTLMVAFNRPGGWRDWRAVGLTVAVVWIGLGLLLLAAGLTSGE